MINYDGKVALITGAGSGIGKSIAGALAARGGRVILADIDEVGVKGAADELGGKAHAIVTDLARADAPAKLIEQSRALHGRLDVVCSNAGIGRNKRLVKEPLEDDAIARLFNINFFAGLRLAQAYVPILEGSTTRGRMMFTGSENSLSVPAAVKGAGLGLYAATKHALLIAAEWLRDELATAPIDLHVLMPGAVYTPLLARKIPDPTKAPPELGLISSERCAEIALAGMDHGLFYIPTHAHLADDMRSRTEGITAALKTLGLRGN
jgi:NAD(P)-dependent dehydrogenase (short-subunit alcohol dehydrogenase family)